MKANPDTDRAVRQALQDMADAYEARDLARLERLMAPDPDLFMFGTGADEKRVGWEQVRMQAERDWAQAESARITFNDISVSAAGPVAWASADAGFEFLAGGQRHSLPARLTATLEERDGRWVFVQSHFSFPAAAQSEGMSFPD